MTAINDAFLRAGRNMRGVVTDPFVESIIAQAKQLDKARKAGSRFNVLPEPAKRFDLRMVERDS